MSKFVDECRKEWRRLGVPEAASNEMAADLEADLAEAAAEGASPEHVLGAGVFDPVSFAASWARARDLVPFGGFRFGGFHLRRWDLLVSGVVCLVAVATGAVILVAYHYRQIRIPPAISARPFFSGTAFLLPRDAFQALALMLLVFGLVGLVSTLAIWKWSALRWALVVSGVVFLVAATTGAVFLFAQPLLTPVPLVLFNTLRVMLLVLGFVGFAFTLAIGKWSALPSQKHSDEVGLPSYV
jgi:hypothetical protein